MITKADLKKFKEKKETKESVSYYIDSLLQTHVNDGEFTLGKEDFKGLNDQEIQELMDLYSSNGFSVAKEVKVKVKDTPLINVIDISAEEMSTLDISKADNGIQALSLEDTENKPVENEISFKINWN